MVHRNWLECYKKDTYLENPEIIVKDSRLLELDEIVNEVKESEEWEAVKMNILEIAELFEKDINVIRVIVEGLRS